MSARFAELDWRETPIGEISLRRRWDAVHERDVYEVKLGDEFLMSSLFTVAEIELARLGLAAASGESLDVVVGGLGLAYTARTALEDDSVRRVTVVEALPAVIDWHEQDLFPDTRGLAADERVTLRAGDFFAMAAGDGFDPETPGRAYDAVLLDIDHTPQHVLNPSHAPFYTAEGLRRLARFLRPGGVFALWSDDPPEDGFLAVLGEVFDEPAGHVVEFDNAYTGGTSSNSVYVARRRG